jgi:hypothetical protein
MCRLISTPTYIIIKAKFNEMSSGLYSLSKSFSAEFKIIQLIAFVLSMQILSHAIFSLIPQNQEIFVLMEEIHLKKTRKLNF